MPDLKDPKAVTCWRCDGVIAFAEATELHASEYDVPAVLGTRTEWAWAASPLSLEAPVQ